MSATSTTRFVAPTGDAALIAIALGQAAGLNPPGNPKISNRLFDPDAWVPNRGMTVVWLSTITAGIATVLVVLRLFMRARTAGGWALDDWLIIPSMVFMNALMGNTVFGVLEGGVGKHSWDLSYDEISNAIKAFYLHLLFYVPASNFVKLSVLFFVKRLAGSTMSRTMSWLVWGNFWFTIVFNTVLMFLYAFQCLPAKANIDLSLRFHPDTRCLNYLPLYYSGSILHAISDLLLIAAPIKLVLGLQMSFKKKVTVCIMLGIGGVAVLCSVVRMGYILNYTKGTDMTWDAVEVSAWGHLEVTLAVASACLPALRPIFTRFFPNLMNSRSGHSRTRSRAWTGDRLGGTAKFVSSKSGAVRTDMSWKSGWSMNDRRHQNDWEVGRGSQTQLVDEIELQKADRAEGTDQLNSSGIMKTMSVDVRYEEPRTPDKVYVHEEEVMDARRKSPSRSHS